ncbi:hypothetical protein TrRE_jg3291 [Triparma retinervis]|uniref:Uncharacterized protein n=1 Tax=Triparma retinervis TaxID=2557542 RepID=A0A9W7AQB7_9STRA|nr:hypothetical protein TrRE_jg3291 [Triparma retinervis]
MLGFQISNPLSSSSSRDLSKVRDYKPIRTLFTPTKIIQGFLNATVAASAPAILDDIQSYQARMTNLQQLLDNNVITLSQYNDMASMELESSIPDFDKVWNPSVKAAALQIWLKNMLANLLQKSLDRHLLLAYPSSRSVAKLVKDPISSALRKAGRGLTLRNGLWYKMLKTGIRSGLTANLSFLAVDCLWMFREEAQLYYGPLQKKGGVPRALGRCLKKALMKALAKAVQLGFSAAAGGAVVGITGNKVAGNMGYAMGDATGGVVAGILGIMV